MYNKYEKLFFMVKDALIRDRLSIREAAKRFNIHYQTVFKWMKHYRDSGEKEFPWCNNIHKKRISHQVENLVIYYKEKYPWITLSHTQKLLQKKKIRISIKCLWSIWKRNGLSGFDKNLISNDFTDYMPLTRDARLKLLQAQKFYEKGLLKESAETINSAPCLPKNDLILRLPDDYLSTKRKIERMTLQFGTIPLSEYIRKAKAIYNDCIKNQLNYSALRIGILLCLALSWYGIPEELSIWIKKVEHLMPSSVRKAKDLFPIYFTMLLSKCHCLVQRLRIASAFKILRYCHHLISQHKKPPYNFLYDLAIQYIDLEDYHTAEKLLNKTLAVLDEQRKNRAKTLLAIYVHLLRGNINTVYKLLKEAKIYDWVRNAQLARFQALLALIEGKPSEALDLAQKALNASKAGGLPLDITNSYLAIASTYMALGEIKKAKELIYELKEYTEKIKMKRQLLIANILLQKFPKNKELYKLSTVNLARILKTQGYMAGYKYAQKKGIMFYFYRYLFFFPEILKRRIKKGKPTFLSKSIMRLPIFNSEALSYRINFLDKLTVYRNQKYLKVHLSPKDTGVLLYVINQIKEPENFLNLSEVYSNFWQKSSKPARIFSHCLVRIKKALDIPGTYLEVRRTMGEPVLVNNNIYFTTDYQEFEQTIARAKALQRAGEWEFAKKEFLQAFKLFRGEPFKKNFDDWSVDMRFRILSELENEAINFAKASLEHNDERNAKKVLEKVLKIIPDSEEIKNLLDSLTV